MKWQQTFFSKIQQRITLNNGKMYVSCLKLSHFQKYSKNFKDLQKSKCARKRGDKPCFKPYNAVFKMFDRRPGALFRHSQLPP